MTSVITGDIINSRKASSPEIWLEKLKILFNNFGKEPKNWEIYRGDSFQIEIKAPIEVLKVALKIKAAIKKTSGWIHEWP